MPSCNFAVGVISSGPHQLPAAFLPALKEQLSEKIPRSVIVAPSVDEGLTLTKSNSHMGYYPTTDEHI